MKNEPEKRGNGQSSIVNGRLVRVSASQLETFDACKRKWAYEKVFKQEAVEGATAGKDLGTKSHSEIEEFLLTGTDNRSFLAKLGHSLLAPYEDAFPYRGGRGIVEAPLRTPTLETPDGVQWSGFIDFVVPPSIAPAERPTIIDHKFKKDIKKYGKTAEELKNDIQAITYSWWAIERFQYSESRFIHHNHQTNPDKPRVEAVAVDFDRAELDEKFAALCEVVDSKMQVSAGAKSPEEVEGPPNPEKDCWKFGGCKYAHVCPSAPKNLKRKKLAELELQKTLQQKKEGKYIVQAIKTEEGKWYIINGEPAKKLMKVGSKIKFEKADGSLVETGMLDDVVESSVIPPDSVIMDAPPSAPAGKLYINVTPPNQKVDLAHAVPPPATSPTVNFVPNPPEETSLPPFEMPTAPTPKKRGRPSKAAQAVSELSTPVEKPVENVVLPQVVGGGVIQFAPTPSAITTSGPQVRIYVEMPVSGEPRKQSFQPYVDAINERVKEKYKIPDDVRLAADKSDLAYGRWKALIGLMAQDNPPSPGAYEAFRGEISSAILDGLRSHPGIMIAGYVSK